MHLILCRLNFKSMFLYQFNYLCKQVLELCPNWPQTPHLRPSTYSKWDLSLVVFVLFLEHAGLLCFLTMTKGSWTWTSCVSKTWLKRAIKLHARGFPLSSTCCRVAVIVCMNKFRGDVGSCGDTVTLTLGRIRGFLSNSHCHECSTGESESWFPYSRKCSDDRAAPTILWTAQNMVALHVPPFQHA